MQLSESTSLSAITLALLKYGGDVAVGAMTILTSVMQFAMLPLQGLGQGAQPIISYNYGARNENRVRSTFKLLLKTSVTYSVILWMIIMIFPQIFAGMFTSDSTLLAFTKTSLRIYMAVVFIFGVQIACQMTFISLGRAKDSIIVAIVRKFVLVIPLIYILPHIFRGNQTNADLYGRTGGRYPGSYIYCNPVLLRVPKSTGRNVRQARTHKYFFM